MLLLPSVPPRRGRTSRPATLRLFACLLTILHPAWAADPGAPSTPGLHVALDLVDAYPRATVDGATAASAGEGEAVGGERRPGIYLHPRARGRAVLRYPGVRVPERPAISTAGDDRDTSPRNGASRPHSREPRSTPPHSFLILGLGCRDGVPWEGRDGSRPNGVRFLVDIAGRTVLDARVRGPGLHTRAIDLSPWADREVDIALMTEAVNGDSNWDWAVFVAPRVVRLEAPVEPGELPDGARGLGLLRVECPASARVRLRVGDAGTGASEVRDRSPANRLRPGTHWLAAELEGPARLRAEVLEGRAATGPAWAAPWRPGLALVDLGLAGPLVTADRAPAVLLTVTNRGRGPAPGGMAVATCRPLAPATDAPNRGTAETGPEVPARRGDGKAEDAAGEGPRSARIDVPPLAPGEETTVRWTLDRPLDPGLHAVHARVALTNPDPAVPSRHHDAAGARTLRFRVFPAEAAEASTPWPFGEPELRLPGGARIDLVRDGKRHAYAVASAIDDGDGRPRRVASLHPLIDLVWEDADGARHAGELVVETVRRDERRLELAGVIVDPEHPASPAGLARLVLYADAEEPRVRIEARATLERAAGLLRFAGPRVLVGDRRGGVRKELAVFPGLEFLAGDEASSSRRYLAPPHHDRRVPEPHEITTPLLAVLADDVLTALLWDAGTAWTEGERDPAARFLAPAPASGNDAITLELFAPSVGRGLEPNAREATRPYALEAGDTLRLVTTLVVDRRGRERSRGPGRLPRPGGLLLDAFRHWIEVHGLPAPSPAPRSWSEEKALCAGAWLGPAGHADPPGFRHCADWSPGPLVGHAVPIVHLLRDGVASPTGPRLARRTDRVLERALRERGPSVLASSAGCHTVCGELPFLRGYLPEALRALQTDARRRLADRHGGLWRWQPADAEHAELGDPGDHTLGQAAANAFRVLRAARLSGDAGLREQGLDALRQFARYRVPRGAQTWECPLRQPDILAAAWAVRAACEAYRLTGEAAHLDEARYWAWTGLPFVYLRGRNAVPAMRYNTIAVFGSTFYTHSWIGLPVVWCGLVYAYALQELAEHDTSFPWQTVARGIVRSAQIQQYADGPHRGCYPDSWDLVENAPRPADINPENIALNALRLRGRSPAIRSRRLESRGGTVLLNSAADPVSIDGKPGRGRLRVVLRAPPGGALYSLVAPVPRPAAVEGAGEEAPGSSELAARPAGWLYDSDLRALVWKQRFLREGATGRHEGGDGKSADEEAVEERIEVRW